MLGAAVMAAALTCAPPPSSSRGVIDAAALISLRDVSGLSLSPDGAHIAYQLQEADLQSNNYHSVWCVAPVDGHEAPRLLGDGGDILMPLLAGLGRPTGLWNTLAARWSPDGSTIAILARRNGQTQIEVCPLSGRGCRQTTRSAGDVRDLVWSADGARLIYEARPSREDIRAALQAEGDRGYHLDDRFDVFHGLTPLRSETPQSDTFNVVDLSTNLERPSAADERSLFLTARRTPLSTSMGAARSLSLISDAPVAGPPFMECKDARDFIRLGDGAVWTAPANPHLAGADPPLALFAALTARGPVLRCPDPACEGRIVEMTLTSERTRVLFIKREGWGFSRHALYLWDLLSNRLRRIWEGDDVVRVCFARRRDAICLHEGPTQPRQIVRVDFGSGAIHVVVDPNANLSPRAFASARKLEWRTSRGDDVFGYLVLAPGVLPHRLPLIVIQYRASGFLRGGVGDEYPVQAFAHRGFAVFVLERPDPRDLLAATSDAGEIDRREWQGLSERWRTLAALTSGIDLLVASGVADARRIGVTGLSDGAETAVFALIHCACIAAAAISGGVHDPIDYYFSTDRERADMRAAGRGRAGDDTLWPDLSLSQNAARVNAPILAQVADRELVFMLQAERTFSDLGRPFDLYLFPNEFHVKWQPRHRAAIYERSLDWFSFWLMGAIDPDPAKREQYARWRAWAARQR